MRCLLIGGGGFLGSHLAQHLLASGHIVRIYGRKPTAIARQWPGDSHVEWVEGDFLDHHRLATAIDGCDAVVHLVSTTLPRSSNENPRYDVESNLTGTLRLLELIRRFPIKRFVFASSGGTIYGDPRSVPILESHPTDPKCSYGIVKLAIEKYLQLEHQLHGLDYRVLRLANPYGERQGNMSQHGAVATFVASALNGQEITIWGDGSVVRDYFHAADAATAFGQALSYQGEHRIFNIGSGTGVSLNEILSIIEAQTGSELRIVYKDRRVFDVPINVLDTSLARDQLKWTPRISLQEGIARKMRWLKTQSG